jgi:hypothetical protein
LHVLTRLPLLLALVRMDDADQDALVVQFTAKLELGGTKAGLVSLHNVHD